MFLYGFDSYFFIFVVPAMLLALYAQGKVKSTFSKYSKVHNQKKLTGAQIAKNILDSNGLYDIRIERVSGNLSDHYDPRKKVVRLSDSVYASTSVAAVGVAAHETGHAVQHQVGYVPLVFRNAIVPVANIGSGVGPWLAILGLIFGSPGLTQIGIALFSAAVLFRLITLPVEFNASKRAMYSLETAEMLTREELPLAKKVLNAAAMTYLAAAAVAIANLLRLVLLSNRRR